MNWIRTLVSRCSSFFRSESLDRDLEDELESHLDLAVEENLKRGMSPEDAREKALRDFGGLAKIREDYRMQRGLPWIETLMQDVRYALRQLRRAPGYTITAVLTLALGIGATTAIFTLVHAVLLTSLPVVKPAELFRVGNIENCCVAGGLQHNWSLFSVDLYRYLRDHTEGFEQLAAMDADGTTTVAVRRDGGTQAAQPLVDEFVSGNYFATFGIHAYEGRALSPADDQQGAAPVAVMSFHIWQRAYGHDPSVVGSSFSINGHPFTIIGIAPPGFFGDRLETRPPSLWIPLSDDPLLYGVKAILNRPDLHWLDLIGRVRPGENPESLQAQLQVELRQWLLSPASRLKSGERNIVARQVLHLSPGGNGIQAMQENYQDGLRLLMWISSLVLAIACANLANLMLVRASSRRQLTSVRAALGASPLRLVRQAMTEALVLAILGGCAGLALAFGGTHAILYLAFHHAYVPIRATPELPILFFAFAVVLMTGLLFGIAPAWIMLQSQPAEALRGTNRATPATSSLAQRSLVVGQAALSLILLSAAGMLTASLTNMQHQRFGFDRQHSYVLHINPLMAGYKPEQMDSFYHRLHDALTAIPGVASVSFSLSSPMDGMNWNENAYIEGRASQPNSGGSDAYWNYVSSEYFKTLGIGILQGRPITSDDTVHTRRVAVVNQAFVHRFFKDQSPMGKHFGYGSLKDAGDFEVVGVVENTLYLGPSKQAPPICYLAASQAPEDGSRYLDAIEIRVLDASPDLELQVRHTMRQIDPNLPILDFQTLSEQVDVALRQQIMIARLTSLFGFLALALATIGLYGVTAYLVEQHSSEIGIRMALGADRGSVLLLVLKGALYKVGAGLAIGIPIAILLGHSISSQLFGVAPYSPFALGGAVALLGLAALSAAFIPARRAAAIEPMQALRTE